MKKGAISDKGPAMTLLKDLENLYKEPTIYQVDEYGRSRLLKGENCEREELIIKKLLEYYFQNPEQIPTEYFGNLKRNTEFSDKTYPDDKIIKTVTFRKSEWDEDSLAQLVISFVISLTNKDAYDLYHQLVDLRIEKGKGFGIEPVTPKEISDRLKAKKEEEYTSMMMEEMLEELNEGSTIRPTTELHRIVTERIKDKNHRNREVLSDKAREIQLEMLRYIAEQAEEDAKLYKAMVEADARRASSVSTDDSEIEI